MPDPSSGSRSVLIVTGMFKGLLMLTANYGFNKVGTMIAYNIDIKKRKLHQRSSPFCGLEGIISHTHISIVVKSPFLRRNQRIFLSHVFF